MKIRRWSAAGFAAAALLLPGVAACGPGGATPSASGSESPVSPDDAKRALLASTTALGQGNFRFAISGDQLTTDGWVHQASQSAVLHTQLLDSAGNITTDIGLVYIGSDAWLKLKLNTSEAKKLPGAELFTGEKFLHVDKSKIKNAKDLRFDTADPAGSELLTKAVVEVRQDFPGAFSGKIDLAKATGSRLLDDAAVKALPAQGTTVPFTAKVDGENRLRELTVQVPAVGTTKAQVLKASYFDYGMVEPGKVPPAEDVVEAPEQLYAMFNQ